jgi:hypothetical protein
VDILDFFAKQRFLLSMNEVNIKYWFRNFQNFRFSGRIRTFYQRKTNLYDKKNSRHSAVCPGKFDSPLLPFPFNLVTSPFGLVNDLVLNRSYWFLDFGNKFRRLATIRIFGSFFSYNAKHPPIWMFLGLKHNKIKFQT